MCRAVGISVCKLRDKRAKIKNHARGLLVPSQVADSAAWK